MYFDVLGWIQTVKDTRTKKDLFLILDDISLKYENGEIDRGAYEELRDLIKARMNDLDLIS